MESFRETNPSLGRRGVRLLREYADLLQTQLAGRPGYIQRLLHCGINSLSVAPPLIPQIKEAIRGCDFHAK